MYDLQCLEKMCSSSILPNSTHALIVRLKSLRSRLTSKINFECSMVVKMPTIHKKNTKKIDYHTPKSIKQ